MLEVLGLDERTIGVYEALITRQDWSTSDIAAHLGVDRSAVREALDRLARLSLLRPSEERPGQLRPVNPSIGLSALLARQEAELTEQHARFARTREEAARLTSQWSAAHALHGSVERLEGLDEERRRMEELSQQAETEVLSFLPGGAQSPSLLAAARQRDEQCLARGVRVRVVLLHSARNDRPTREYADWLLAAGADVRVCPSLPIRLVLCDGRSAMVPIDPKDDRRGAIVVAASGVVMALSALFETVWDGAEPFGERTPRYTEVTPQERRLLMSLRSGLTDEAISRQLGVSVRTARRMLASLMEKLDARCRFEAGYEAARRGWL
ncbi:helix-turn-helix domain-containing protein [Streptomyces sp. NPDC005876]|uniref:helix-turn-helix transcriptional regulator n=1 Tax=Streptomyces sp. NPDC005876 TaxID=3157076 RepID=UPI0034093994